MAKRKVFGRLKFEANGRKYRVEMKPDGIWVRELHHKSVWRIPFQILLKYTNPQFEMFTEDELDGGKVDAGHAAIAVPSLPEIRLVPGETGNGAVHAVSEQQAGEVQNGGGGLAA